MKVLKRVIHAVFGKPDQITLLKRAMQKNQSLYDDLLHSFDYKKHCCLTCASGGEDLRLYKKMQRQAMMLRVMLRKRASEKDLKEITILEFDFGKKNLDDLEKIGGK